MRTDMNKRLFLALCMLVSPCLGFYQYRLRIPNGEIIPHPCKPNYMWAGVGHLNLDGGGDRNPFGVDFEREGNKWTRSLCFKDSDGDGKTNGEELGDPNCQWREGMIPEKTKGLSHPGVCDPHGEGICYGRDTHINCDIQVVKECDVINNPDVTYMDVRFQTVVVPPKETTYYCQYFDMPTDEDFHIVADKGIVDNAVVIHHFLLFGCPDDHVGKPTDYSPNQCYMGGDPTSCTILIGFWAVGFPGACYGDSLGYKIGKTGYKKLKLEAHYNNPEEVVGYMDASGMRLYIQPAKPGVQDLATLVVGQMMFEIPPGQTDVEVSGSCPGQCSRGLISKPMYVMSAVNHMHYMGRSQRTEVRRNGELISVVADDPRYNYDSPTQYQQNTPLKLLPGDHISTTCLYSSMSRKRYTYFGDGTFDEMCFSFLTFYPADAMPTSKWCLSWGPLSTCEYFMKTPKFDCDWARFANLSNYEMWTHYMELEAHCNIDGTCRPECKKIVDQLMLHPCLRDKGMERVVTRALETYKEGARFLGRLHSCSNKNQDFKPEVNCEESCPANNEGDSCPRGSTDSGSVATPHVIAMTLMTLLVAMVIMH